MHTLIMATPPKQNITNMLSSHDRSVLIQQANITQSYLQSITTTLVRGLNDLVDLKSNALKEYTSEAKHLHLLNDIREISSCSQILCKLIVLADQQINSWTLKQTPTLARTTFELSVLNELGCNLIAGNAYIQSQMGVGPLTTEFIIILVETLTQLNTLL